MNVNIWPNGDSAVTVELGTEISIAVNQRVRRLMSRLKARNSNGILEMVPAYASLTVHYRPDKLSFRKLESLIQECAEDEEGEEKAAALLTEIPVLYGGQWGPDLEACARIEGISPQEMIRIHSGSDYYIYMLGFAPGHPYCARMENPFSFKRRETPRIKVSARSVVVSAELSNILPFDQPCGWNIIGRTPVEICDYAREDPFLLEAGQWVRFCPVTEEEYRKIRNQVKAGVYSCRKRKREVEG